MALNISYVLPVYNAQSTVSKCIKSLLNQRLSPFEIIILDDNSSDNTLNIINYHKERNEIIKVVENKERKGAAYNRNKGNSMSGGDIIAVCDSDFYFPQRGDAIHDFFKRFKEKGVFYSSLQLRSSKHLLDQSVMDAYEWDFNSKCPISHPTVAYKKEVSDECPYHEDSIETDLYEFFLLDAYRKGYLFGGCQDQLMVKIEGDSKRDVSGAKELKQRKYKEYGIKIS